MLHYADLAVVLATVATLTFLVPQVVKLVRTRDASGVSSTWPAFGVVANVGWVAYLVHQSLWMSVVAPLGTALGYAATLVILRRVGSPLTDSAVRGATLASVLVTITTLGGWDALGVALGLSHAVTITPSIWSAYRTRVPSGVSAGTWGLGLIEALLWGVYGWYHADAGIVTFAIVALLGAALMLARWNVTRRRTAFAPAV